jgi:adenine phosphoribosyltransferase
MDRVVATIRAIPDFPKPGILFRDITPMMQDPEAFRQAIDALVAPHLGNPPDRVAGIESRGFLFAAAMAYRLGCGCVVLRKPGKLPWKTRSASYSLEYGTDSIEIHEDAVTPGQTVVLVDDLLATGGTMQAAAKLVRELGGQVIEQLFVVELADLNGRAKLEGSIRSLLTY